MLFRNIPVQKKLMRVILLISGVILLVTCVSFFVYEYYSFRKRTVQELSTLGQIISANSTAALAFQNPTDADDVLAALKAQPNITSARLYDKENRLFANYPSGAPPKDSVFKADWEGYRFTASYLETLQPVMRGERQLGTLYLRSDLKVMYNRFRLYGIIAAIVFAFSFLLAYFLSRILQSNISQPILDLVETAKAVAHWKDYSVRATRPGNDEFGLLTDAFNQMLEEIHTQNQALSKFNQNLEQKVQERTAELEALNKELDSFSYSISHDLRAPLRAINGYMTFLYEDYYHKLDDEGKSLIDTVLKNSKRMGMLIDDLLAFSRLGRQSISKSLFPMKNLVTSVWEELSKMENGRAIEFTMEDLPDTPGERNLIQQVWVNLISNALKYSANKEKTVIQIAFEKKDNEVVYRIKDNGAGFRMEYYNKLFGVFQRLHSQQEFDGTGVGLAIVQRILEKHGGKIWAEAKVDEGATFYFSLPCQSGSE